MILEAKRKGQSAKALGTFLFALKIGNLATGNRQ